MHTCHVTTNGLFQHFYSIAFMVFIFAYTSRLSAYATSLCFDRFLSLHVNFTLVTIQRRNQAVTRFSFCCGGVTRF